MTSLILDVDLGRDYDALLVLIQRLEQRLHTLKDAGLIVDYSIKVDDLVPVIVRHQVGKK